MLPIIEDPNTQKQLRRSEQIKKWNEREMMSNLNNNNNNNSNNNHNGVDDEEISTRLTTISSDTTKYNNSDNIYTNRTSKVRFPKGCVFLAACSSGDTDEVRSHLKMGVNINTTNIDGLTALHQACIDANIEMVKFLVENNADINSQDNEGWTPLHAAVSVGNLEVSKYLIGKGARLNICNNDSDLPIDLCDASNTQIKEFLDDEMKRQGIDADYERKKEELIMYEDARDKKFEDKVHSKTGATPLHVSAAKGYTRVMKLLLQSGADVNAVDKDGWTSLHAAAHWEQEEACLILCEYGADFEIRNYSEQTPYEVCEGEMVNKLKQIEANSKLNTNKLTDVTSINNKLKSEPRNIRQTDEFTKPSIVRIINEEKSNLTDKKQDKILLSPITMPSSSATTTATTSAITTPNQNNESNESSKKVNDHFDKENQQISSNSTTNGFIHSATNNTITTNPNATPIANSNANSTSSSNSNQDNNQPKTVFTTKPSSMSNPNRAKPGLHESLKSLSAQVRMMDEEKDDLTDKSARWGPSDTSTTTTATFKRRIADEKPSTPSTNPTTTTATTTTTTIISPLSPSSAPNNLSNDSISAASPNSSNNSDANSRRYSSAPVASKDEQAELIRKQKAKLERHFRRSTTAVSYEDIKSAEATIKSGVSTPTATSNTTLNKIEEKPTTTTTTTYSGGTNNNIYNNINNNAGDQPPSTPPPPIPTSLPNTSSSPFASTVTSNSNNNNSMVNSSPTPTTALTHGVSSLSTLFGEPIKQPNSYYHTPATFLSNNSITPLAHSPASSAQASLIDSQRSMMSKAQIELSTTSQATNLNVNNNNNSNNNNTSTTESTEKDNIIANDIETDKLLNVIEKSKGFSDSKSTQARRLRNINRQIPIYSINNLSTSDEFQPVGGGANTKKINKLVWNPERLEIEYKEEEQRSGSVTSPDHLTSDAVASTHTHNNNTNAYKHSTTALSPDIARRQTSTTADASIENLAQTAVPPAMNTTNASAITQPHSGRSMFRFENTSTNQINNMPSTDRRPMATTTTPTITTINSTSPNSNSDVKIIDYQIAYEQTKKENESLNQMIIQLKKELDESKRNQPNSDCAASLDKREKRAFDRRISELEEEVKKVENLKQDNSRLKEENAALIRVISKLSK